MLSPRGREWALALVEAQPASVGRGVADQLQRVCAAVTVDLDLSGAAVTLKSVDRSEAIAAASDPASRGLAELEFGVGEGPARDAFDRGRPVLVAEFGGAQDGHWPAYSPAARAFGVGAVFAFPLQVGASRFGVLTLFSQGPRQLGRDEVATCVLLAELATEMLLDSSAATNDGEIDPDLKSALGFRGEIYQAQGMVMVALGIALPEALALIRAHAFTAGRTLVDVALDIVAGRLSLTTTATTATTDDDDTFHRE